MRLRSGGGRPDWGRTWVVDEVLQSGRNTYTVFCVARGDYLGKLRDLDLDLPTELLELARRTGETVSEARRRRRYSRYLP